MCNIWDKLYPLLMGRLSVRVQREILVSRMMRNDIEGVHRLLKLGIDPNFGETDYLWDVNASDLPPVFIALRCNPEIIKLLFEYGADPHTACGKTSPYQENVVGLLEFYIIYVEYLDQNRPANIFMYDGKIYEKKPITVDDFLKTYKFLRQHLTLTKELKHKMDNSELEVVVRCCEWEFKNSLEKELSGSIQQAYNGPYCRKRKI